MSPTRTLIVAAGATLFVVGHAIGSMAQDLPRPKVIAVQVFAEWCGSVP